MRSLFFLTALILLSSCNNINNVLHNADNIDSIQPQVDQENPNKNTSIDTIENAQKWLETSIKDYFLAPGDIMQVLTTPEYYEFKMDAMNIDLDLDGSLSKDAFEQKWKNKFDLKTHPTQTGFLISAQDWGKIEIDKIKLISKSAVDKSYIFDVIIKDAEYNTSYDRTIKVVLVNNKFFIADVIEKD